METAESLLPPYESADAYNKTEMKESTSADVLGAITKEDELLSQSKSVVASQGIKKKGHKLWLTMVTFDENTSMAKRKCFFIVDEKAESVPFITRRRLDFDIETVLEGKVLEEPYANENARRIAILSKVLEDTRRDIDEVAPDNKMIVICGGLINQTLSTVLQKLKDSPVLATKLSGKSGLGFEHITIGKGKIVMNVTDDIAAVRVRSGGFVWGPEDPFSLEE
ncbi:MAG: hypothetical protein JW947_10775 [Sedimentisphaerales bacterium]|nr:hypothetical protein [Sedimentisphaerales bacterium]